MTADSYAFGLGSRGDKVGDLRARLAAQGLETDSGESPGEFGPSTENAVRAFQQRVGLTTDGIVGPETWEALVSASYRLGDRLLYLCSPMLRGDDVAEVQSRLNSIGFEAGRADGVFGPETRVAVSVFQRNAGVVVDGVFGPETHAALASLGLKAAPVAAGPPAEHLRSATTIRGRKVLLDPAGETRVLLGAPATAHDMLEARLTLAVCEELALALRQLGAIPLLSRGAGQIPTAEERAAIANDLGAEVVVSIGLHWSDDPDASGTSCHYFAGRDRESGAGKRLAELCLEELLDALGRRDCRTTGRSWTILRRTKSPAVVVEPLFLSNPEDSAVAESPGFAIAAASAIARALDRYFSPAA